MEVEKIAPIATSPLDLARGRGKTRISMPKRRKERRETNFYDIDGPMVVILCIPESHIKSNTNRQ
jgi:hypothetical protein